MLNIKNLCISIGLKSLIENFDLNVNKEDKIAIIGEEGVGKSTLLKAINKELGEQFKVTGDITSKYKIGMFHQTLDTDYLNDSVHDYLFKDYEDYYKKINQLYKLTSELNIEDEVLERKMINTLSGGEQVKIRLLKILLNEPDIIFLDEPSNDLDLKTLIWLENFIKKIKKPVLYISHDEELLEKTANRIIHLELIHKKTKPLHTISNLDYKTYINQRLSSIQKQNQVAKKDLENKNKKEKTLSQIMNRVEHEQRTISRKEPGIAAKLKIKMRGLKSQEKKLDNSELTSFREEDDEIYFYFHDVNIPSNKTISIEIDNFKISTTNIDKINLTLRVNDKIVITGQNGVGKTTLIKEILEYLRKREDIKVGYLPQDYNEELKKYQTPTDYLSITGDKEETELNLSYLGNMNFSVEELLGEIKDLSAGSKAKLILTKLIINKYNVLILDEPTRNVSPLSNPVIREALKNFGGIIISISHDRKYIKEVATINYEMTSSELINNLL